MFNEISIYLIIALNVLTQLILIRRQKLPSAEKWKYYALAGGIPAFIMLSMRLLIANGIIPGRIADQSAVEQYATTAASILLIAGPWLVTLAAVLDKQRKEETEPVPPQM